MSISADDTAAIEAMIDSHIASILSNDPDAFLATCTDDIQFFPPDAPTVSGQAACRAYLVDFPTPKTFTPDIQNIEGEGDIAYSQGQAHATFEDGDDVTFTWMSIVRKQGDGSWKMSRDMWVAPE